MIIKLDLKGVFDNFYSQLGHSHSEQNITYSNVLKTTAQTLSGAINEHENDINTLNDYINKITSVTIDDGRITSIDQDYILIDTIDTDFTVSCIIEINSTSDFGELGLGIIYHLPDHNMISNINGISVKAELTPAPYILFDQFNDDSHIQLQYNHPYKFVLKRENDLYTGSIYDTITTNCLISTSIIHDMFEYIIIWGVGHLNFSYSDVQLNADYLLKTQNQTIIGAINELYDDQEYTLVRLTNKINEL